MKKQFALLGLILLHFGSGGAYPMESEPSSRFLNALKDEIRAMDMINQLLVLEKDFDMAYPPKENTDDSSEIFPCLNLGNDGCLNGYIIGSGKDRGFLEGMGSPGK